MVTTEICEYTVWILPYCTCILFFIYGLWPVFQTIYIYIHVQCVHREIMKKARCCCIGQIYISYSSEVHRLRSADVQYTSPPQ